MTNFLEFIDEDIVSKKSLLTAMPTNTKTNIKKFNEKINAEIPKYLEYKELVKKYLTVKCKSFEVEDKKESSIAEEVIADLESHRFILNPANTFYEKMGFDNLFYKIGNYNEFNFDSLNEILNEFLSKFEEAGIILQASEFDYTGYVNEFMKEFISLKNDKENAHDKLALIFEKIYWENPEIIVHIELNFRKLIKSYEKKFVDYINKAQHSLVASKGLTYELCLEKLSDAYRDLAHAGKETVSDITELAKSGQLDISSYFADSKSRISVYDSLMIEPLNYDNPTSVEAFYENLEKLKINIIEYSHYLNLKPLFDDFKTKYLKAEGVSEVSNNLKEIQTQINQNETKLAKLNGSKVGSKFLLKFFAKKNTDPKNSKFEIIKLANEIHTLYKTCEEEYFKSKVGEVINNSFTVADVLHLYYSFDAYKKRALKDVFRLSNYDEIAQYSSNFDEYAMNPLNVISNIVSLTESGNIAKIIVNKYRLTNINITEDDLAPDNLNSFIDKIDLVLRIKTIEESPTSVEKIWFIAQVEKMFNNDKNY